MEVEIWGTLVEEDAGFSLAISSDSECDTLMVGTLVVGALIVDALVVDALVVDALAVDGLVGALAGAMEPRPPDEDTGGAIE